MRDAELVLQKIIKWNIQAYYALFGYLQTVPENEIRNLRMALCRVGVEQNIALLKVLQQCLLVPVDSEDMPYLDEGAVKDIRELEKIWHTGEQVTKQIYGKTESNPFKIAPIDFQGLIRLPDGTSRAAEPPPESDEESGGRRGA